MVQIRDEHLAFMHEARKAFSDNNTWETYMNEDDFELIALRVGMDRDCILIYELGNEIANFVQQMEPKPNPKREIMEFAFEMERTLGHYSALENKDQAYVYGSMQNIMNSLFVELNTHGRLSAKTTSNMCVNLAAQAMLLAKAVERHES